MDTVVTQGVEADVEIGAQGKLYRFLSLCFAHPDESTLRWWQGETVVNEVLDVVSGLPRPEGLASRLKPLLDEVAKAARELSPDNLEATYIAMFSCGVPQVLCPPYSSLYTSADDDKRLEDMLAVKMFYGDCGMEFTEDYKDLPDHACVEFEFLQYLTYEESRARAMGDERIAGFFADKALGFIDRHALGFVSGMAAVAARIKPRNIYCHIVDMAAEIVRHDRECRLVSVTDQASVQKGQDQ